MEIKVVHRYAKMSPYKVRLVADLIRGATVDDAFATLRLTRKRAASMITKLLRSAVASAAEQHDAEPEDLVVARAWVDGGPMRTKWWPRPRGALALKRARTSHINLVVASKEEEPEPEQVKEPMSRPTARLEE